MTSPTSLTLAAGVVMSFDYLMAIRDPAAMDTMNYHFIERRLFLKQIAEGRGFYCSLGHVHSVTWDLAIMRFYLAGIQYAFGDLKADDSLSTK